MDVKAIGQYIRKLRKGKGFSQQDLARELGITWEMVSRYERGKSSPMAKIDELSKIFKIPLYDFFKETQTEVVMESVSYSNEKIPLLSVLPSQILDIPTYIHNEIQRVFLPADFPYEVNESLFAIDASSQFIKDPERHLTFKAGYLVCQLLENSFQIKKNLPFISFKDETYYFRFNQLADERRVCNVLSYTVNFR